MLIHSRICMHLAESGAPAAMKRRSMEPVNKVKILPVLPLGLDSKFHIHVKQQVN
jgi:hypothetical protein